MSGHHVKSHKNVETKRYSAAWRRWQFFYSSPLKEDTLDAETRAAFGWFFVPNILPILVILYDDSAFKWVLNSLFKLLKVTYIAVAAEHHQVVHIDFFLIPKKGEYNTLWGHSEIPSMDVRGAVCNLCMECIADWCHKPYLLIFLSDGCSWYPYTFPWTKYPKHCWWRGRWRSPQWILYKR